MSAGQSLHIRAADTDRLLELARDWVPRHGSKVKTLAFTWWTTVDLGNLPRLSGTPKIQQALNEVERFTGSRDPSGKSMPRMLNSHNELIATILRGCPNLLSFKVLQETATTSYFVRNDGGELPISPGRVKDALCEIGSKLRSANLIHARDCLSALEYLEMTPNIEHLSIRIDANPSPLRMGNLFQKLSQLPQLVSLEIDGVHPTALESLSALPCSKLTQLILSGTLSPQLGNLIDVLKIHPITSLCLRDASTSDGQLPSSRPDNLPVRNLSISGRSASVLLDLFDAAPLEHVEVGAGSGKNSDRISPKRLKAFIMKHRTSLLSFKTDRLFFSGSAFVSTVNRMLAQEDISVRVVTVGRRTPKVEGNGTLEMLGGGTPIVGLVLGEPVLGQRRLFSSLIFSGLRQEKGAC